MSRKTVKFEMSNEIEDDDGLSSSTFGGILSRKNSANDIYCDKMVNHESNEVVILGEFPGRSNGKIQNRDFSEICLRDNKSKNAIQIEDNTYGYGATAGSISIDDQCVSGYNHEEQLKNSKSLDDQCEKMSHVISYLKKQIRNRDVAIAFLIHEREARLRKLEPYDQLQNKITNIQTKYNSIEEKNLGDERKVSYSLCHEEKLELQSLQANNFCDQTKVWEDFQETLRVAEEVINSEWERKIEALKASYETRIIRLTRVCFSHYYKSNQHLFAQLSNQCHLSLEVLNGINCWVEKNLSLPNFIDVSNWIDRLNLLQKIINKHELEHRKIFEKLQSKPSLILEHGDTWIMNLKGLEIPDFTASQNLGEVLEKALTACLNLNSHAKASMFSARLTNHRNVTPAVSPVLGPRAKLSTVSASLMNQCQTSPAVNLDSQSHAEVTTVVSSRLTSQFEMTPAVDSNLYSNAELTEVSSRLMDQLKISPVVNLDSKSHGKVTTISTGLTKQPNISPTVNLDLNSHAEVTAVSSRLSDQLKISPSVSLDSNSRIEVSTVSTRLASQHKNSSAVRLKLDSNAKTTTVSAKLVDQSITSPAETKEASPIIRKTQVKVSKKLKRLRLNQRLRTNVKPKNAIAVLNETNTGVQFKIQESQSDLPRSSFFIAHAEIEGKTYTGQGTSKQLARQDAAENAFKSLMLEKLTFYAAKAPLDAESDGSVLIDDQNEDDIETIDGIPWSSLASFALYKLFLDWQYQGCGKIKEGPTKLVVPKELPPTALAIHPVMLLNQMRPGLVYTEVSRIQHSPNTTYFTLSCTVDDQEFTGTGKNKKDAKKQVAKNALHALYNLTYPEEKEVEDGSSICMNLT